MHFTNVLSSLALLASVASAQWHMMNTQESLSFSHNKKYASQITENK